MQLFEKVEVDKPQASRSTSAEIYLVALKYKAPAKIDPRLLDIKHLFQGGKEPPKVIDTSLKHFSMFILGFGFFIWGTYLYAINLLQIVDVLRATKQKRHRDG